MFKSYIIFFILLTLPSGCLFQERISQAAKAEELTRKGDLIGAISAYQKHISKRISDKKRPEWENPYFYLLMIGDLELRLGDSEKALKSYELAENKGVEPLIVADRYRYVAMIKELSGDYKTAIQILTKYRERDPLLFDLTRDRISKEMTAKGL
jgi:tetratricopeptide (TPR) repeat protein